MLLTIIPTLYTHNTVANLYSDTYLNTYTWLLAMRSCAISTFSLPFTTK